MSSPPRFGLGLALLFVCAFRCDSAWHVEQANQSASFHPEAAPLPVIGGQNALTSLLQVLFHTPLFVRGMQKMDLQHVEPAEDRAVLASVCDVFEAMRTEPQLLTTRMAELTRALTVRWPREDFSRLEAATFSRCHCLSPRDPQAAEVRMMLFESLRVGDLAGEQVPTLLCRRLDPTEPVH